MMRQADVHIRALSPLVLTADSNATVMTKTQDTINGSVLRGVLAARYMRQRGLNREDAHLDADFRRFFFGSVRFVDANPVCPETGTRSFALPLSLQREKARERAERQVIDLIRNQKPLPGMKTFSGYGALQDELIHEVKAAKNISFHMSRGSDKERRLGRSDDGGIFNYESLDPGQSFTGAVIGPDEDLNALLAALAIGKDGVPCRIGRSRFTQYGACLLQMDESRETAGPGPKDLEDNALILRLDTPFIPEDAPGQLRTAGMMLSTLEQTMNDQAGGDVFSIQDVYAAGTDIGNYVSVWNMKRPRQEALAAGTVFRLVRQGDWTPADFEALETLMFGGIGQRTEEGFGQLRLSLKTKGEYQKPRKGEDKAPTPKPEVTAIREEARLVFHNRLLEQMKVYAAQDVLENMKGNGGKTHFFARLDSLLQSVGQSKGCRQKFAELLLDTLRENSPLEKGLRGIRLHDRTLYDLLVDQKPGFEHDWKKSLSGKPETTQELMEVLGLTDADITLSDGDCFAAYWHWIFRYARKKASTRLQKGGRADA